MQTVWCRTDTAHSPNCAPFSHGFHTVHTVHMVYTAWLDDSGAPGAVQMHSLHLSPGSKPSHLIKSQCVVLVIQIFKLLQGTNLSSRFTRPTGNPQHPLFLSRPPRTSLCKWAIDVTAPFCLVQPTSQSPSTGRTTWEPCNSPHPSGPGSPIGTWGSIHSNTTMNASCH